MPLYTGREFSYFWGNYIDKQWYRFCHSQGFSSLTPAGDLIGRHPSSGGSEWGNHGANWSQIEYILKHCKIWNTIPVIRAWLFNLDMSDAEWNRPYGQGGRRPSAMNLPTPQPKITYSALHEFMRKLELKVETAGFDTIIFLPCWEFNQHYLASNPAWWWGYNMAGIEGQTYRDWYITPSTYESFMSDLIRARDAVAPRIRIGVSPEGAAGRINWSQLDFANAWNNNYGRRAQSDYLSGYNKCNLKFDKFGVTLYPRNLTAAQMANQQIFNAFLGEQWIKRIVDLVGIGRHEFALWEYNGHPTAYRANANFVQNSYTAFVSNIDDVNGVNYGMILWYMSAPNNIIDAMAEQYYGYIGGPVHRLKISSTPVTSIPFMLNGVSKTTPFSSLLQEGTHIVKVPEEIEV